MCQFHPRVPPKSRVRPTTIMPSNGEVALDETGYEMFKENKFEEAQQVMDDLDDFDRRLAGGAPMAKAAAKAAAKVPPVRAPAPKPGVKKAGSEYVKASRVAKSEEEVEADDARKAVSDLDKFDQRWG